MSHSKIGPKEAAQRAMREANFAKTRKTEKKEAARKILVERLQSQVPQNLGPICRDEINDRSVINVNNGTDRQRKWRDANPETNRERARNGMRSKHAATKAT
jgi:hypothetical protein